MNTCYKCDILLPDTVFIIKNKKPSNLCKNCHNAYIRERQKGKLTSYENRLLKDGMIIVYCNKNGSWVRRFAKRITDITVIDVCYFNYKSKVVFNAGDWVIKFGKTTLKTTDLTFRCFYKFKKPE